MVRMKYIYAEAKIDSFELRMTSIDLRTNYIQFVLTFFQHGDAEIKKQALSVKGLVSALYTHMYEDAYPVCIFL